MPSDQQKMYDYASDVNKLLSSDLPNEDIVVQIGSLVRDAVETVRRAMAQNTPVHVPSILLSASVEFDRAYRPGGTQTPRLDLICEDDQRVKSSVWYQGMNFAQRNGFYRVLPVVVVTLPQGQKRRPADLPLRDQPRNLPNATLV